MMRGGTDSNAVSDAYNQNNEEEPGQSKKFCSVGFIVMQVFHWVGYAAILFIYYSNHMNDRSKKFDQKTSMNVMAKLWAQTEIVGCFLFGCYCILQYVNLNKKISLTLHTGKCKHEDKEFEEETPE